MKMCIKKIVICLLFVPCIVDAYLLSHRDTTSRSFMFTRPANQNIGMFQSGWHNIQSDDFGPGGIKFQVIPFYQDSRKNCKTAHYFLPCAKNNFLVAGDDYFDEIFSRDIRAEWLGLPSD